MTSVVTVNISGQLFTRVISLTVARDLENVAGTFEAAVVDDARLLDALPDYIGLLPPGKTIIPCRRGAPITVLFDNEPVLVGWIDKLRLHWSADKIEARISGRDKAGDLVDCAALPYGPAEFRGVDLLHVATIVCKPFGITVKADVDVGAPFERLALHKHMTALAFLESAARQRSVLLVSDGVGGLLLTRGGNSRAPDDLLLGDNIQDVDVELDERFSDYFVMQDAQHRRSGRPAMDHTTAPLETDDSAGTAPATASAAEAPAIGAIGHATDPEVTRWRPTVRLTRSQSGMSSVQEQAEWMCRVAKGTHDRVVFPVLGFCAGAKNALWRPNQLAAVWEPYSGIDKDMLIAGVTFQHSDKGQVTRLRICGPSAYDRINEADRKRNGRSRVKGHGKPLDSTVTPLSAP